MVDTDKKKVEEALTRGVEKIYPSKEELKKKLLSGERLRIYQGFDPSMSSLHLGNLVGVIKLRQFLELGHEVIFLIGDFTGMIGDPTDKESARENLSREEVRENCKEWKNQISNIIKVGGRKGVNIKFNSSWLDGITFKELIEITSNFTVQQMLQRDFFQRRLEKEKPIYLHEFLYPVAQALDAVEMEVDLEVGGSDQTFNMLVGRHLSQSMIDKEKFVLTTELLIDKEGNKVGKTTGNAVFLDLEPKEIYGRIMSFPDETIVPGFELLTLVPMEKVRKIENQNDPMQAKKRLAFEVVKLVKGEGEAEKAQEEFERVFEDKKKPEKMKELSLKGESLSVLEILTESDLVSSRSEGKRLIKQRAVRLNDEPVNDWRKNFELKEGDVVQVGKKRFIKVV